MSEDKAPSSCLRTRPRLLQAQPNDPFAPDQPPGTVTNGKDGPEKTCGGWWLSNVAPGGILPPCDQFPHAQWTAIQLRRGS